MSRDQWFGYLMLAASMVVLVVYAWALYSFALLTLQATALVAVGLVLVVLAWIGYTMATTPPPVPLETELPTTQTTAATPEKDSPAASG